MKDTYAIVRSLSVVTPLCGGVANGIVKVYNEAILHIEGRTRKKVLELFSETGDTILEEFDTKQKAIDYCKDQISLFNYDADYRTNVLKEFSKNEF